MNFSDVIHSPAARYSTKAAGFRSEMYKIISKPGNARESLPSLSDSCVTPNIPAASEVTRKVLPSESILSRL